MSFDDDLIQQLHSALVHLDDPPYLETLPLARRLTATAQTPGISPGQTLRRALRLAIAKLDPGSGPTGREITARSYQVLYHYAISRQSMIAIARRLGISRRQGYRELRRATEALAQIIGDLLVGTGQESAPVEGKRASRGRQVREELERLSEITEQDIDMARLVNDVVEKARHLARSKGIEIQMQASGDDLHITGNRVMLRQAFLYLLSHMVTVHQGDRVTVEVKPFAENVQLSFTYRPRIPPSRLEPQNPYEVAAQILDSLGIPWYQKEGENGTARIIVSIPLAQQRNILVIDDNQGIIALFRRYLRQHAYRVHGATSAAEALELLDRLLPDVIILDIMMPDQDGWEVLDTLRARPDGQRPHIIVCSIVNDPQLAAALGADAFLNKPASRAQLLQTLKVVLSSETEALSSGTEVLSSGT